ncbi:hypothetical protein [Arthrobacter sp. UYEF20]|uniref:hypothetical protein n=1 Tax=Arthrobacter sp. UYEF20 TaxID=1756363 RepID=UPI00339227F1
MNAMTADDAAGLHLPPLQLREPGLELKPEEVESPTLPLPPPRDREELDRFLNAVAFTPTGQRGLIKETIAGFDGRSSVADLLHQALFELPVQDTVRHLMILAVIGELGHESSRGPLERFVWLDDGEVHGPAADVSGEDKSVWYPGGVLQARAAEMLVFVTAGRDVEGVRRILREHQLVDVRVATIDAFAYAGNDAPETLDELRRMVREDDRWAVGLPRRWSGGEAAAFDEAMERHDAEFGARVELPGSTGDSHGEASDLGAKDVR